MATTMTVEQSGDRIEIEIHAQTPTGEQRIPDVYVLDGQETDFRPPIIGEVSATGKRTSRWSEGRNGFEASERATVQGPSFLVEYDNSQNNANHIHTVWRDFDGDFGRDLLREHYRNAPHPR